jgi:hypothetical protein
VSYPGSTDLITNGLALCRIHHGAFDNSLLGIDGLYNVVINPNSARRLKELQLDSYLPTLTNNLPEKIFTPHAIEARPTANNLRKGMELRRWPAHLIQ